MKQLLLILLLSLTSVPAIAAQQIDLAPGNRAFTCGVEATGLDETVVELRLNHFDLDNIRIEGDEYATIDLDRWPLHYEAGCPALPTFRRSLLIPAATAMQVQLLTVEYEEFDHIDIAPSKGLLFRDVDPDEVPHTFSEIYDQDAWYPSRIARLEQPYILRDTRGVVLEINPFRYNPATHTLRVYTSVTVAIRAGGPGKFNVLSRRPARRNAEFEQIYRRHYLNYAAAGEKYSSVPEVGPMLIVTADAFHGYVQPLCDWKNQMGISTRLVDMSSVGASAGDLLAFIQAEYDTNGVAFVLLVGDAAQIPYLTNDSAAADPMYALLAGSDSYPDIFVGRLSAENATDVATQITRSIEYERDPQVGADWYHRACGIASDDARGGPMDWERMAIMRDSLLTFSYTEMDEIYDPGATIPQVASAVNAGRSVIQYLGHGHPDDWCTTDFSNSDVNALVNDNMLPWIISVACNTGQFHNTTCFAEAWMRATNGGEPTGACAMYASTVGMSWDPPVAAQYEIIDLLITGAKRTFGALCFNGSCEMMDQYGSGGESEFKNWTVFGDPSLRIRSDLPTPLVVNHGGIVVPGLPSFNVNCEPGALACLSKDSQFLGSAFAAINGVAEIEIVGSLPLDNVTLTVTGFNKVPHWESVPVGDLLLPTCDVIPAVVTTYLPPDNSGNEWFRISNNGEAGSTLHYIISLQDPDYPTKRLGGEKDMTGSTVRTDQAIYSPGTTMELVFSCENASPDNEWLNRIELDFPPGVEVLSAEAMSVAGVSRIPYGGATGDGVTAIWSGGYQPIFDGEMGVATVSLEFSGVTGDVEIPWLLQGDGYGGEPHLAIGTVVLTSAGPNIVLLTPAGGETWPIGSKQPIEFLSGGGPEFVQVELDRGSGSWDLVGDSIPAGAGIYHWSVTGPISASCRIKVSDMADPAVADSSETTFTIFRPLDWIGLNRYSGVLAQGGMHDLQLTLDTTGLPEATYHAEIVFTSNAGVPVIVPVTLVVEPDLSTLSTTPETVSLAANQPNPFNPSTVIRFNLPKSGVVDLAVFDASGRLVKRLLSGNQSAGPHQVVWNGTDDMGRQLASGLYLYRLRGCGETICRKMLLLK